MYPWLSSPGKPPGCFAGYTFRDSELILQEDLLTKGFDGVEHLMEVAAEDEKLLPDLGG